MSTKSLLMVIVATFSLACAHRSAEKRAEPRAQHVESRADWTKLGERWVDGVRDRDVIPVGARDGRYRKIMIVVENSALEMHDVVVTFGDGDRFSPPTRSVWARFSP